MLEGDSGKGLNTLHQSAERGNDPVQFARQVVAYLRNVLLMKLDNSDRIDVPDEIFEVISTHSAGLSMKQLL